MSNELGCPCNSCKYRMLLVYTSDMHIYGEDCPKMYKCNEYKSYIKRREKMNIELWIVYKDGNSGKAIKNVTNYGFDTSLGMFFFDKNGYRSFIPKENVKFIGPRADYFNLEEQSNEE